MSTATARVTFESLSAPDRFTPKDLGWGVGWDGYPCNPPKPPKGMGSRWTDSWVRGHADGVSCRERYLRVRATK